MATYDSKISEFILYRYMYNLTHTLSGCHTCKKKVKVCFENEIQYLPLCELYVSCVLTSYS